MFGEISLVANSGAGFHKASMAVNMGGTWMQGLNLSSYQGSTLRHAVVQLQLLMQGSVGVCSHERKIMKEDERFECNNTSTRSIMMLSKLCDACAQTLSITWAV